MIDEQKISANIKRKIEIVNTLSDKINKAKTIFLTDYRGLTHQQVEKLKKALKKAEAEFLIAKNTLLARVFEKKSATFNKETKESLIKELKNPTATLLAYGNDLTAIKILSDFIKIAQLPKIKIGIFAGKLTGSEEFTHLANLPTREVLLATLVYRLKSPVFSLHYGLSWNLRKLVIVLNNVKDKK